MAVFAVVDEAGFERRLDARHDRLVDVALALFAPFDLGLEVEQLLPVDDRQAALFRLRGVDQHAFHVHSSSRAAAITPRPCRRHRCRGRAETDGNCRGCDAAARERTRQRGKSARGWRRGRVRGQAAAWLPRSVGAREARAEARTVRRRQARHWTRAGAHATSRLHEAIAFDTGSRLRSAANLVVVRSWLLCRTALQRAGLRHHLGRCLPPAIGRCITGWPARIRRHRACQRRRGKCDD